MSTILVTGGAGFIGSHTCIELLNEGHNVIVIDNFRNSTPKSLEAVKCITQKSITLYHADVRDEATLMTIFEKHDIDAVIHFAGLKAVGESSQIPLEYYDNNINGTLVLLRTMKANQCYNIIFSSSATVYGNPKTVPITETASRSVTNPYGRTKLILEDVLADLYASDNNWNIVILRYFNPIGAHESGDLGEDPKGIPNNLLPYVTQVAVGKLEKVGIFGDDYNTLDGTGVRDYIHVVDLAKGHVAALKKLFAKEGLNTYNLGTGQGYSVLEIISTMSEIIAKPIPYTIMGRRLGDIAICYADITKAQNELGWQAEYGLKRMCEDAWRWQFKHPNGFLE